MLWLYLSISAYFVFAFCVLIDKYLLKNNIPQPEVFAFYVGILGLVGLVLVPFGFNFVLPSWQNLLIAFLAGAFFIITLLPWYYGLQKEDASMITPLIGGLMPIFSLVLAWLVLGEKISPTYLISFIIIIAGSLLISWEKRPGPDFKLGIIFLGFLTALFSSISIVLAKLTYLKLDFINGFVWIRLAVFASALCLLFLPKTRKALKKENFAKFELKKSNGSCSGKKKWGLLILGQCLGAMASIALQYAFLKGKIALINVLQGVQYVFLFILTLILSLKFPQIIKESLKPKIILQKIASIALIIVGIIILSIT